MNTSTDNSLGWFAVGGGYDWPRGGGSIGGAYNGPTRSIGIARRRLSNAEEYEIDRERREREWELQRQMMLERMLERQDAYDRLPPCDKEPRFSRLRCSKAGLDYHQTYISHYYDLIFNCRQNSRYAYQTKMLSDGKEYIVPLTFNETVAARRKDREEEIKYYTGEVDYSIGIRRARVRLSVDDLVLATFTGIAYKGKGTKSDYSCSYQLLVIPQCEELIMAPETFNKPHIKISYDYLKEKYPEAREIDLWAGWRPYGLLVDGQHLRVRLLQEFPKNDQLRALCVGKFVGDDKDFEAHGDIDLNKMWDVYFLSQLVC